MKKKIAVLAVCGMCLLGGAVGGAYAMYSGWTNVKSNQITVVAGKSGETIEANVGEISEDLWVASKATKLAPNESVPKNPSFTSKAEYDCYAFMTVTVPRASMKIGAADTASYADIVTLEGVDSDGWEYFGKKVTDETESVYLYGYKTVLVNNAKTSALFTSIKVPNISELATTKTGDVDVKAYIVQSEGYNDVTAAKAAFTEFAGFAK